VLSNLSLSSQISLAAAFTLAVLTSCAHVPDVPVCVEINQVKGFCTNTISDHDFTIDEQHPAAFDGGKPQTWWDMRPYMVLVPMSSWKAFKEYIIQQCKRTNCDQYIQSWDRKIQELDGAAAK
jgi:hypothetical protein